VADDNAFRMELVTPERVLFLGAATQVVLRTADGDLTFLNGHTPLVGSVLPGVVRITDAEGAEIRAAVHGGFVQVEKVSASGASSTPVPTAEPGGALDTPSPGPGVGTRVSLLAGVAELAGDIDVERARLAAERAEALVAELASSGRSASAGGGGTDEPGAGGGEGAPELVEAEAALERARVRLETVEVPTTA